MAGRFEGRVAIVTGAAGGQGRAEVKRFLAESACVVGTDIAVDTVDNGDNVVFVEHDVTDEQGWAKVVGTAMERWGRVDVLVNNAGIYWQRRIEEESVEGMKRMLDVDLVGPFLGLQAVVEPMREQRSGSIVNIASIAGCSGFPAHAAYGAAKWGLRGLTKTAAVELGPYGVRVNCVLPGAVATAMRPAPADGVERSRVATPDEIASVVAFLASDDAAAVTGIEVVADGGFLVGLGNAPLPPT